MELTASTAGGRMRAEFDVSAELLARTMRPAFPGADFLPLWMGFEIIAHRYVHPNARVVSWDGPNERQYHMVVELPEGVEL